MRLVVISIIVIFLLAHNTMYLPLEDLHNSVHQYFPNDQCIMSQKYALVKNLFKI